jgi:hypothetical protein
MDYVTRQFINLTKKFRKEIPKFAKLLSDDIKQHTEAVRETRHAYKQSRNTPPILRAELQVPHPIEVQTTPKDKKTGREWYKLVIETLTLLGIVAYAIITVRMWREMIFARHQSQLAMETSKKSADQALEKAKEANEIAVAGERPWVGILFAIQDFQQGKAPRFTIQYLNSGRRPAKVISSEAVPNTYTVFPKTPFYKKTPGNIRSAAVIVPNGVLTHSDPLPFPSDTELAELRKFPRKKTYYLYGSIEYEDVVTHATHWTHGCLQYYPEYGGPFGSWVNCPFYNEVDEEER